MHDSKEIHIKAFNKILHYLSQAKAAIL